MSRTCPCHRLPRALALSFHLRLSAWIITVFVSSAKVLLFTCAGFPAISNKHWGDSAWELCLHWRERGADRFGLSFNSWFLIGRNSSYLRCHLFSHNLQLRPIAPFVARSQSQGGPRHPKDDSSSTRNELETANCGQYSSHIHVFVHFCSPLSSLGHDWYYAIGTSPWIFQFCPQLSANKPRDSACLASQGVPSVRRDVPGPSLRTSSPPSER